MNKLFTDAITHGVDSIQWNAKQINQLTEAGQALAAIDLSDVQYVSTSVNYEDKLEISLTLKESNKASKLPHKLAQHFGVKFTKAQSWDKSSLVYTGKTDKYIIEVRGAVPQTCTIEYVEEPIPENQIVRTRKRAIINCVNPFE